MNFTTELDAEALYADLLNAVRPWLDPKRSRSYLVGVASGGAWLAERLQHDLGLPGAPGILSSTLHRDDFAQRGLAACTPTQLPFDVEGAHLTVVDDVIYTGRTLRAVLNELFDYGRPASVRLAVLVDRGGRQLPMTADWAAAHIHLPADQSLALARDAQDKNHKSRFSFALRNIAVNVGS